MGKFYIYRHIRLDTNTPFYIGKGSGNRAYDKRKKARNRKWHFIANKADFRVEIILKNLSESEAFEKEIEFIKIYKKLGFKLANMSDGGEGRSGFICSEETRKKLSKASKGRVMSKEHIAKISLSNTGKKHSEETKRKMSIAKRKISKETKDKMSKSRKLLPSNRCKGVIDIVNGYCWDSIKEASDIYGINVNTLVSMLNNTRYNRTDLRYLVDLL